MSFARYLSKLGAMLNSSGQVPAAGLASGAARANFGAGAVLQVVQAIKTDTFSTSSTSFVDIPNMSVSITPTSSTSKILIRVQTNYSSATGDNGTFRLLRDATVIGVGDAAGSRIQGFAQTRSSDIGAAFTVSTEFLDSPSTTSSTTYKVQLAVQASTNYVNRTAGDENILARGRTISTITLMEIAG